MRPGLAHALPHLKKSDPRIPNHDILSIPGAGHFFKLRNLARKRIFDVMQKRRQALPFETPKLTAVGVGYLTRDTFAERLERAIARNNGARLIATRAVAVKDREG
jgi:hypothetical protein